MGQMRASVSSPSAGMKDGFMASIRKRGIPSTSQLPPPSLFIQVVTVPQGGGGSGKEEAYHIYHLLASQNSS